jgi:2-oxo-4-hydroxy-4-carboxy-5-ureidoimidazoline decarboxylase
MAVSLDDLNRMSAADFVAALGAIYEHSPWVAEAAAPLRPFASLAALHAAMEKAVRTAGELKQLTLIRAHPDLAGKLALAGKLTDHSASEQAGVGLDRLDAAGFARFTALNDAYRGRFGFPFIICVRRHSRASILTQFERRVQNGAAEERETAVTEIIRIAALRLDQAVTAADRLPVHGRLSTHVLDTHAGRPAKGIAIQLFDVGEDGPPRLVAEAVTNADGRTDAPLIAGRPAPVGTYELRFRVGPHFAGRPGVAEPPFLDLVPLRFSIAEPEGHYHVPLLVTPWSFSTYRGS